LPGLPSQYESATSINAARWDPQWTMATLSSAAEWQLVAHGFSNRNFFECTYFQLRIAPKTPKPLIVKSKNEMIESIFFIII
jgi:hypothetical protein